MKYWRKDDSAVAVELRALISAREDSLSNLRNREPKEYAMAGLDVGGGGARRARNHDIPLIPFIDFLLCLVMFLLVTAVWSHMARIEADAKVPSSSEGQPTPEKVRELHVDMKGSRSFKLVWKEGATVVSTSEVPRREVIVGQGFVTYPDLAAKIEAEWKSFGSSRAASDRASERAVLHSDDSTEFKHLVAVLDAIQAPRRADATPNSTKWLSTPAFRVVFASD